jgi:tRNA(adenine34) deaminase
MAPMTEASYMEEAIKEARIALEQGNWPIGCVIVLDGKIIARAHNEVNSSQTRLAHAEMLALRAANDILREHPREATLYTTYEPCPMCFGGCVLNKIKKVVAGIDLDQSGAMYFREHLPLLFKQDKFHVEFERGLLAEECAEVFLRGEPTKKLLAEGRIRVGKSSEIVSGLEREL